MARVGEIVSIQPVNDQIRCLLQQGRVREARELAAQAAAQRPDSELLARWRDVLTPRPARLTGKATGRSMKREAAWLRQHAQKYKGQWVALKGDRLLAFGPHLSVVREQARAAGPLSEALFHFIPHEPSL